LGFKKIFQKNLVEGRFSLRERLTNQVFFSKLAEIPYLKAFNPLFSFLHKNKTVVL